MTDNSRSKNQLMVIGLLIVLLILVGVLAVVAIMTGDDDSSKAQSEPETKPEVRSDLGTTRPEVNPFHHAREGDWVMRDVTPLLKTNKYTSSRAELEQYLVREVPAGSVLRITADHGRWKEVQLIEDGKPTVPGWVDSEESHGTQSRADVPAR